MLKILKRFLKPYMGKVILVVLLTMVTTLLNLSLPMMSKRIIDTGIAEGGMDLIIQTIITMLVISVVSIVITITNNTISSKTSMSFSRDLRKELFHHVSTLSQGDVDTIGSASLISRQGNDVTQMQTVLVQMMQIFLVAPLMCIGGMIMAFITAPKMAWIIAVILPLAILAFCIVLVKAIPVFAVTQKRIDKVNRIAREALNGMRVIRAFNKEEYETEHFAEVSEELRESTAHGNKLMMTMLPVMNLLANAANILIALFGAKYLQDQSVKVGDIQAFILYVSMILMAFMLCSVMFIILPRAQTSGKRIMEVFDTQPSVNDPENPVTIAKESPISVEFEHVSFHYPRVDQNVLTDINFKAEAGQVVAIIGGTGSGKSTLLNLLPRYYDVTEGSVKINGVDIRDITQDDLRDRLAVIPQKSFLFGGSIYENICYGKKDATPEEVQHALDVSQSADFVKEKEYGIYSYITPAGTNVSGGQRQRLAIARALVRKPDVYLFDDSFSALDFKTDAKLRKALKKEVGNSIMIIVAQRVSTIRDADRILVLEKGQVVGDGTHDELMSSNETYREIALSQLSESEVKGA